MHLNVSQKHLKINTEGSIYYRQMLKFMHIGHDVNAYCV
jgi:hypothetical protein